MKITLKTFLVVGFLALAFLVMFKWIAGKTKIAGLQSLAANA